MTTRHPRARLAAALLSATMLMACTQGPGVDSPTSTPASTGSPTASASSPGATSASSPGSGTPSSSANADALARFYVQDLTWTDCDGAQCAQLTVPVDYAAPEGATIDISLLKVPARGERVGSLVVNPGGPGGSGVDFARWALSGSGVTTEKVAERFDIVGFDPRGVSRSAPVECLDPANMDEYLSLDPSPDDAAEESAMRAGAKELADACQEKHGDLLPHLATVDVAKDMDVLRAALGDEKLNYLGKSYGTYLGATYAELFPTHVGRMVLDGAMDPTLSSEEVSLGQAEGFDRATRAYLADCVAEGDCPLGDTEESAAQGLKDFFAQVDRELIPVSQDVRVTELTEGWAMLGVASAMYDQSRWSLLTTALRLAKAGDGSGLMVLANAYADRRPDGSYGNIMQAIYAVNCLDRPEKTAKDRGEVIARFEAKAPIWGEMLSWGSVACEAWPAKSDDLLPDGPLTAKGSAPILVIGTTRDPATPYEWAVSLAEQLDNGRLISFDGDGHTAYRRSNSCVDDTVDAYYLEGTVPEEVTTC